MPSSKKRKVGTVHLAAKKKCESPPRKSRSVRPAIGTPPQEIPKPSKNHMKTLKLQQVRRMSKKKAYLGEQKI